MRTWRGHARHSAASPPESLKKAPRHRRRFDRRTVKRTIGITTAAGVVGAAAFAGASVATAEPTDQTEALGKFLGGSTLSVNLDDIAALEGAHAEYPSGETLDTNPLAAEVLNAVAVDLGDSLQLFGPNGVIALGAVNQYAEADAEGAAAASGAVSDQGAISVGGSAEFPSDATVSLTPLLPELADGVVSQLDLELGALSASAAWPAGGEPTGDYDIAGAMLQFESPLVGGVYTDLQDAIVPVQGTLDDLTADLTDALDGLINLNLVAARSTGTVDVTLPDLTTVLPSGFVGDGAVQVNLQTGEVLVDLEQLLAENPDLPDLNDLPANYEILNGDVIAAIGEATTNTITSIVEDVAAGVRTAVENTAVSVDINFEVLTPDLPPTWTTVLGLSLDATLAEIDSGAAVVDITTVPGTEDLLDTLLELLGLESTDELESEVLSLLLAPIGDVFDAVDGLDGALNNLTTGLATEVVDPVLDVVTTVVSLTGNVQEQPGDLPAHDPTGTESFTQRALQLTLLPGATPLAQVNLASATVRAVEAELDLAVTVTPDVAAPGDTVTVDGTGYTPSSTVTVEIRDGEGTVIATVEDVPTDAEGTFTTPVTIPGDTEPGAYVAVGIDDTTGQEAEDALTIEVDGTEVDGTEVDGTEVDGTEVDGTEVDGTE
ncbi:hypothetical protein L600_004700000010, partial [Isoptericola variabilis J7]